MEELAKEIIQRYPLLANLCIADSPFDEIERIPRLVGLLLSVAENEKNRKSCVFVLPVSGALAHLTSAMYALISLRRDYDKAAQEYATRKFTKGDVIRVLPSKHVYIYEGLFTDTKHFKRGKDFFKLRVIDTNDSRSLHINQILRIEPTTAKRPKGKLTTDLSNPERSDLDRLLDLWSFGNESMYENRVIYLTSKASFEQFLLSKEIASPANKHRSDFASIIPWGALNDDGTVTHSDPSKTTGEPIIAVTRNIDHIVAACERKNERGVNLPCIIVDGSENLTKNIQAFDTLSRYTRCLAIDSEEHLVDVQLLEERDCVVWHASPDEIRLGSDGTSKVLSPIYRAARNKSRLSVSSIDCSSDSMELLSDMFFSAVAQSNGAANQDTLNSILGFMLSILFRLSGNINALSDLETEGLLNKVSNIKRDIIIHQLFMPDEIFAALNEITAKLEKAVLDPNISGIKKNALLDLLEEISADQSSIALVVRYRQDINGLTEWLKENDFDQVDVYYDRHFPPDREYDHIVLVSWLNIDRFKKLLGCYASPKFTLLTYGFEKKWVNNFIKQHLAKSKKKDISKESKASLLGVDDRLLPEVKMDEGVAVFEQLQPDPADLPTIDIDSIEKNLVNRKKGFKYLSNNREELILATYVNFSGESYSYVTSTHKLPVVTHLIKQQQQHDQGVKTSLLKHLIPGDFVLFREGSDADVVQLFAQLIFGKEKYSIQRQIASAWRRNLLESGQSEGEVIKKLKQAGISKHYTTISNWMNDKNLIGPKEKDDVQIIQQVFGGGEYSVDEVWNAIEVIRSTHSSAGFKISDYLLSEVPKHLDSLPDGEIMLDLGFGQFWIVEVESIAAEPENFPVNYVNRLLRE